MYTTRTANLLKSDMIRCSQVADQSQIDDNHSHLQPLDWVRWGIENQGFLFSDIVGTRAYVVGQENVAPVSRGLKEIIGEIHPTSTVVGVPALGRPNTLVEIEAVAVRES